MTRHLFLIAVILTQARALADGGAVQMRKEAGTMAITVFTAPTPLAVGPVDISVLVQNKDGLEPELKADVLVLLRKDASTAEIRAHATRGQAQNKLLYAAAVTIPEAGKWQMSITTFHDGSRAEITGAVEVLPGGVIVGAYCGYIVFPILVIVFFVLREFLIARKTDLGVSQCEIT